MDNSQKHETNIHVFQYGKDGVTVLERLATHVTGV